MLCSAVDDVIIVLLLLTVAVGDGGQRDAVLQQVLFGPVVHGVAEGQHRARLLLLQQIWGATGEKPVKGKQTSKQSPTAAVAWLVEAQTWFFFALGGCKCLPLHFRGGHS